MSVHLGLPQFSHVNVEGYKTHLESKLKNHLEQIDELLKQNHSYTWDNLLYPLETFDDDLEQFWSPLSHLHAVVDSPKIRACYEECLPLITAYESKIGQNKELYEAIKSIDQKSLDKAQQKIIKDTLLDFELSGVALSQKKKERFEQLETREAELSTQFENNILDSELEFTIHITNNDRLKGIPEHATHAALELAKEKKLSGYLFNLEYPSFKAVMSYAEDRSLRESMYEAYVTRASDQGPNAGKFDNTQLIDEILAIRHEQALLLGFNNYAELSLATKMAHSTDQVIDFMNDLVKRTYLQAVDELTQLKQFANEKFHIDQIKPWDVGYLSEKRRQDLYSLSQEELRPYFPQPKVMEGLFAIVYKLYGMKVEEIKGVDTWHKDVQCYCIVDEHNEVRGYLYSDLYARQNKQSGAWMDSLQSRRKLENGKVQLPIATLTCNFAKPVGSKPALLSHDEVLTLFHEFGHCLQHLLTTVDYLSAAGINGVEWDAVELPSQFFENWCWDKEALALLTAHIDTGESLPDLLFDRLNKSKNYQSAMAMLRQLEFSLFDFRLHQLYDSNNKDIVNSILKDVRSKTSLLPIEPYNRFQNSFSHIFGGGYAAGYYSYSWAEVLSSDAFSRFEEEGIFNEKTGKDFLHCILETGGSMNAAETYRKFRGRDATIDALLRHNGINA